MIFFENKKDLKSEQDNTDPPPIVKSFFTSSQLASLIQKNTSSPKLKVSLFILREYLPFPLFVHSPAR